MLNHDQPVRRKSTDSAEPATAPRSAGPISAGRWAAGVIRPAVTYAIWPALRHASTGAPAGNLDLDLRDTRHFHHHLRAHRLVSRKQGQAGSPGVGHPVLE